MDTSLYELNRKYNELLYIVKSLQNQLLGLQLSGNSVLPPPPEEDADNDDVVESLLPIDATGCTDIITSDNTTLLCHTEDELRCERLIVGKTPSIKVEALEVNGKLKINGDITVSSKNTENDSADTTSVTTGGGVHIGGKLSVAGKISTTDSISTNGVSSWGGVTCDRSLKVGADTPVNSDGRLYVMEDAIFSKKLHIDDDAYICCNTGWEQDLTIFRDGVFYGDESAMLQPGDQNIRISRNTTNGNPGGTTLDIVGNLRFPTEEQKIYLAGGLDYILEAGGPKPLQINTTGCVINGINFSRVGTTITVKDSSDVTIGTITLS